MFLAVSGQEALSGFRIIMSINNKFLPKDSPAAEKALTFLLKPSKLRPLRAPTLNLSALIFEGTAQYD